MTRPNWAPRPVPPASLGATVLGRWEPHSAVEVSASRRRLAAKMHDGAPATADEGALERLLLVHEELVSNALRHGRPPICVELSTYSTYWLVNVSDAATDRPPSPALDRDPAHGGLGLHMVAHLCGARGWTVIDNRKHVWAQIDVTRPEAPGVPPAPGC
ncbi:MAG TPA: ATP-binding protein [Streptomyces sp.]|uniref:ATP-binding protein n=1 Tax=Streptomyces sp. TaxID=1931 RepID=UPI002C6642BA|nr:ATP-binding protein [Streptomyces sp.]HWU11224.1 ATP-binding protein [Streptomyces sp.]